MVKTLQEANKEASERFANDTSGMLCEIGALSERVRQLECLCTKVLEMFGKYNHEIVNELREIEFISVSAALRADYIAKMQKPIDDALQEHFKSHTDKKKGKYNKYIS